MSTAFAICDLVKFISIWAKPRSTTPESIQQPIIEDNPFRDKAFVIRLTATTLIGNMVLGRRTSNVISSKAWIRVVSRVAAVE